MHRLPLIAFALTLALYLLADTGQAMAKQRRADGWVLIASQEIDGARATTIDLSGTKGAFKGLRLVVRRAALDLAGLEIRYADGSAHVEQRSIKLRAGQRTPTLGAPGERFLASLGFTAANASPGRKAQVEVYGLQSPAGARAARTQSTPPGPPAAAPEERSAKGSGSATPAARGEVLFGTQRVGFGVDRDVIRIGGEIGKFERMRMRVLGNDVFLREVRVLYFSGDPEVLAVDSQIEQDTWSDWLKIDGRRFIREIELIYRSRPNFKGQARIELYGEFAPGWLGPKGEARRFNQGWVLLGARAAGFLGYDDAVIPIGSNEGEYRRLRVSVKERAITLVELRIVYLSGAQGVIPIQTRVEAGASYGPVDIEGAQGPIKEIHAKYRSRIIDTASVGKGAAVVEIWGQH